MSIKEKIKTGAKTAYGFAQRIEFAPEERVQRGEYLFGLRKTITAKPPKKRKAKTPPKKRKPSRAPNVGKATKIKPTATKQQNDTYVKVGKFNPAVKKYPVSYKRGNKKYRREWFTDKKEANKFAKSIAKELKIGVTYE